MTQTQWTPEVQAMWERLEGFQFNDNKAVFDFSARLAKENGWSHAYTARALQEYKRFLLMAMHAGHQVTPSEAVDQAWHLHLVYTRSYWETLCKSVLGRPLHHEPTAGGIAESTKFRAQYQQTLDTYRDFFQEEAPSDLWPSVEECFKPKASLWIDASRHWLIPKPGWLKRIRPAVLKTCAVAIFAVLTLAGCQSVIGVFDMRGTDFLRFYAEAFGIALLISFTWVKWARGSVSRPAETLTDPYKIAFLNGGGARVVDAAMAVLYGLKLIKVEHSAGASKFRRDHAIPPPLGLHEVEWKALNAIPETGGVSLVEVRRSLTSVQAHVKDSVISKGLIYEATQHTSLQWKAALPLLFVMLMGVTKAFIGASRGKPIIFLVILLVISLVILIVRLMKVKQRTPVGEAMWKQLKKTRSPRYSMPPDSLANDPMQAALLVALGGYAVLQMPAYADLHTALKRPGNDFDGGSSSLISSCSTSSSGGTGCGSSDSGGSSGGCGGGSSGCGGCGGGGGGD